jgi:error-prone DNA polymerase
MGLPLLATNGVLVRGARGRRRRRRLHLPAPPHHAGRGRPQAVLQPRAPPEGPRAMAELFGTCRRRSRTPNGWRSGWSSRSRTWATGFPTFPVPAGESQDSYLKKMTYFGAQQRYGSVVGDGAAPARARAGAHREAGLQRVLPLRLGPVLLRARPRGSLVQGRGSAANSAVCYSLGITAVDPIESKLLFERFLSEGRTDWPDIDLDLPSGDRREELIQEVYRKYGRRGAAMTANVITYRGPQHDPRGGQGARLPGRRSRQVLEPLPRRRPAADARAGPAAAHGGRARRAPEARRARRHLQPGPRPAAPPRPALGRDGVQHGGPGPVRAARERADAGALGPAVGQERHARTWASSRWTCSGSG